MLNVFTMFGDEVAREEGEGFAELGEKLTTDEVADGLLFFVVGVDVNFKLVGLMYMLVFDINIYELGRAGVRRIRPPECRGRLRGQ